jgi:hypothetical protein
MIDYINRILGNTVLSVMAQDIIILYDHNTYFLSSPVCQACIIDLYRKMTEQFRPELFDDSEVKRDRLYK